MTNRFGWAGAACAALALSACTATNGTAPSRDQVFAPTVDPRGNTVDQMVVGHRLMAAKQHELALEAYTRAAGDLGLTSDVLAALGSANLGLGRLNQAERQLRQVTTDRPDWPEAWNNLGATLMGLGKTAEATEVFRKAFALDNGRSDAIRTNLTLALQKLDETAYSASQQEEFRLVRRGSGDFLIARTDG